MALVTLSVYDIKHPSNDNITSAVSRVNAFTRDAIGVGGIFHGAIEVFGDEYSFGYCERGTGVYRCDPRANNAYVYRESVGLGITSLSPSAVRAKVASLRASWPGSSYDVLGRNCNHFCHALCAELGCEGPPAWLNAFANGAHRTRVGVEHARASAEKAMEEARRAVSDAIAWAFASTDDDLEECEKEKTTSEGSSAYASGSDGETTKVNGEAREND